MLLNAYIRFHHGVTGVKSSGVTSGQVFVLSACYIFPQTYLFYVVHCFIEEMENDNFMSSAMRTLTEVEVADFENGLNSPPPFEIKDLDEGTQSLVDRIQYQRYKKEDFEIHDDMLELDKINPLGSGNYGKVYKGYLTRKGEDLLSSPKIPVAVKTVDPATTDVICFKALLTELKVMAYLGSHKNVVELLGASTSGIRDRNLLIVSEFCALGALGNLLVGSRGLFYNLVKDGVIQSG